MTAVIATSPKFQFSGADGLPLINGTLTTYLAGTTTPTTTWQDRAQATANTNPIVLDGNGECLLWLDPLVTYKFVLANSEGTQQWSVDNISGATSAVEFNAFVASLAASGGSALVGFIQDGSGAVSRTAQSKMRESVSVKDFGAVGDDSTDDTAAIQAAFSSGAKDIYIPAGTYKFTATLNMPAVNGLRIVQAGTLSAVLKKYFNGTAVNWNGGEIVWENCCINGQGATYTGATNIGISVGAGAGFSSKLINPRIYDTGSACIRFVQDSGSDFKVLGGLLEPTLTTQAAIDHTSPADTGGAAREFIAVQSGGRLIDFAFMETTMVSACNTNFIAYDSTTKKASVVGCRISSGGATININGVDNVFVANTVAGNVDVTSAATNATVLANTFATGYGVTNSGATATGSMDITGASYTPTWTSAGTQPALGNGTIVGTYDRNGRDIHANGQLVIGSTSTFGTGEYRFSLPFPNVGGVHLGTALILDSGTAFYTGVCLTENGQSYVAITTDGAGTQVQQTVPITFAAGDIIRWDISYRCSA